MKWLGEILQIFCIIAVITGVYIECKFKADTGFILLTLGSLFFAVSEKYKRYQLIKRIKNSNNLKSK